MLQTQPTNSTIKHRTNVSQNGVTRIRAPPWCGWHPLSPAPHPPFALGLVSHYVYVGDDEADRNVVLEGASKVGDQSTVSAQRAPLNPELCLDIPLADNVLLLVLVHLDLGWHSAGSSKRLASAFDCSELVHTACIKHVTH